METNMKQDRMILWGGEILLAGHTLRMTAEGSSMFPSIRSGDTINIKPVAFSEITVGDIIVYRCEQMLVAHRLIKKKKDGITLSFITKGDYRSSHDIPISASQILGKVISIERKNSIIRLDTKFQKLWSLIFVLTSPVIHVLVKRAYFFVKIAKKIFLAPVKLLKGKGIQNYFI